MFKFSAFGNIIGKTFTDRLTVYKYTEVENTDGTSDYQLNTAPELENQSCRISFTSPDSSESFKNDTNPIYLPIKLFCAVDIDIEKGDKIIANRLDDAGNLLASYEGIANKSFVYTTHKEIYLTELGDA